MFPAYTPDLNPGVTNADKNDIVLWLFSSSEALIIGVIAQACVRKVWPLMIVKESTVECARQLTSGRPQAPTLPASPKSGQCTWYSHRKNFVFHFSLASLGYNERHYGIAAISPGYGW